MSTIRTNKIDLVPGTSQTALTLPNYTQVEQLYSMSGTIRFDTISNNGWYQPINYTAAIKRYANIGGSTYGPNGGAASFHGNHVGTVNEAVWCADKELFNVITGCQLWRVPITATYTLTARGAGRNMYGSSYGRSVTCDFKLYAGEWLRIVCGAQGQYLGTNHSGGHGASCISVFRQGMHIPVLIGGGGAGVTPNSPASANSNRNATPPMANPGDDTTYTGSSGFYAARDGMGGMGSIYQYNYTGQIDHWGGGGGGGWGSPGAGGGIGENLHEASSGGRALSDPCPHGGYYESDDAAHGGFGGGGASGKDSGAAGGGGGWYGGNSSYATSTAVSDDTTFLGGGSYSAVSGFTDNGTHDTYGQVDVSL